MTQFIRGLHCNHSPSNGPPCSQYGGPIRLQGNNSPFDIPILFTLWRAYQATRKQIASYIPHLVHNVEDLYQATRQLPWTSSSFLLSSYLVLRWYVTKHRMWTEKICHVLFLLTNSEGSISCTSLCKRVHICSSCCLVPTVRSIEDFQSLLVWWEFT